VKTRSLPIITIGIAMKRSALYLAIVFYLLAAFPGQAPVSAKDTWTSVRSKNFLQGGTAGHSDG